MLAQYPVLCLCHRLDRALIALAVVCVLMMPVDYHGGADASHAHAVFQFWDSGNRGALDHHDHSHTTSAGARRVNPSTFVSAPIWEPDAANSRLHPFDSNEPGNSFLGNPTSLTDLPPDIPLLTDITVTAERALGLAVAVVAALLLLPLFLVRKLDLAVGVIPAGLTLTPGAPPPRPISFAA